MITRLDLSEQLSKNYIKEVSDRIDQSYPKSLKKSPQKRSDFTHIPTVRIINKVSIKKNSKNLKRLHFSKSDNFIHATVYGLHNFGDVHWPSQYFFCLQFESKPLSGF